jgi:hypothetical protein
VHHRQKKRAALVQPLCPVDERINQMIAGQLYIDSRLMGELV